MMMMWVLITIYAVLAGMIFTLAMAVGGGMYSKGPEWWEALLMAMCWPLFAAALVFIIPVEKYREIRRAKEHKKRTEQFRQSPPA